MAFPISPMLVKRFGAVIMVVNIAVAFFSFTDMYLLASGALQVDIPDDQSFETTYDPVAMELVFRSEFTVTNDGFYDIKDMSIRSRLRTSDGDLLIVYDNTGLTVPRWSACTFPIEARLPIERVLELGMADFLFNDTDLDLRIKIEAYYVMGLVHFKLDQVLEYPWTAPLSDYEMILTNDTLTDAVMDLLKGDYDGASVKVLALVYGAFMDSGGEARMPLNDHSDMVVRVEGDDLHVSIELHWPVEVELVHFVVPLDELGYGDGTGAGAGADEGRGMHD